MEKVDSKKRVQCENCGYSWETESKMVYVSCPSCLKKVKISENKKGDKNA